MSVNKDKVKRERSVNFNIEERDMLVALALKYKDILENKHNDASSWKNKENAWKCIEEEFNARSGGTPRSNKNLRIKYEGLKRTVRKKTAAILSELYGTGGSNTAIPLDSTEEKLKDIISLSADGMESLYDSDVLSRGDPGDIPVEHFMVIETSIPADTIELENMEKLPGKNKDTVEPQENGLTENIDDALHHEHRPRLRSTAADRRLNNKRQQYKKKSATNEDIASFKNGNTAPCSPQTSDGSRRNKLKTRRHPALIAKRRSHRELTRAKIELVQLQKQLVYGEIEEKRIEAEFKIKQRQWMEEEHQLKMQLLRKQLE